MYAWVCVDGSVAGPLVQNYHSEGCFFLSFIGLFSAAANLKRPI